jgi:hypothetical protein
VSVRAFVDESFRDGSYLLTADLVQPGDLSSFPVQLLTIASVSNR